MDRQVLDDAKAALRARVRAARRERDGEARASAAAGLRDVGTSADVVRAAGTVACFVSGPAEPGTGPLRQALRAAGTRVLLPVVTVTAGGEPALDWALDDGSTVPGPYAGIAEPAGPRFGPGALSQADVVLVPALAADTCGRRLGQGGGYYDRALPLARPDAWVVAVVHDAELFDGVAEPVPALPHDRPVDAVLTPTRWLRTAAGDQPVAGVGRSTSVSSSASSTASRENGHG